jgi:hypothetical protein
MEGKEEEEKRKEKGNRIERQNWSLMLTCISRDTVAQ